MIDGMRNLDAQRPGHQGEDRIENVVSQDLTLFFSPVLSLLFQSWLIFFI